MSDISIMICIYEYMILGFFRTKTLKCGTFENPFKNKLLISKIFEKLIYMHMYVNEINEKKVYN